MKEKTRITALMRQRGITFEMIGEALGCSKQAVHQMVQTDNPRLDNLERIAKAIGVPTYQLLIDPDEVVEADGSHFAIDCPHCHTSLDAVIPVTVKCKK